MDKEQIQNILEQHFQDATVRVSGENGKFEASVISEQFAGLGPVDRHRMVYAAVTEHISSGALHALSIHTYTQEEYDTKQM